MGVRLVFTLLLAISAFPVGAAAPTPCKPVDPAHYLGRWYEIARTPNLFERGAGCSAPTAEFSADTKGGYRVVQTCHRGAPDGPAQVYRATARILDPGENARLRLTYFLVVSKDYWIIDRAEDYRWAILGDPAGEFLWVLARAADMPKEARSEVMKRVSALGYDPAKLEFPAH